VDESIGDIGEGGGRGEEVPKELEGHVELIVCARGPHREERPLVCKDSSALPLTSGECTRRRFVEEGRAVGIQKLGEVEVGSHVV